MVILMKRLDEINSMVYMRSFLKVKTVSKMRVFIKYGQKTINKSFIVYCNLRNDFSSKLLIGTVFKKIQYWLKEPSRRAKPFLYANEIFFLIKNVPYLSTKRSAENCYHHKTCSAC